MPDAAPSALPRPIVPSVPSNRFALLGSLGAVLAARLSGRGWPQALSVGGAGFVAWALGRELDPDDTGSANLALLLAAGAALTRPPTPDDLLSSGALLSGLRVLVASVGHPASPGDALALSAQAGLAGALGNAGGALGTALALLASGAAHDRWVPPAWAPWAALGAAGLGLSLRRHSRARSSAADGLLALLALAVSGAALKPAPPTSRTDQTDEPLSARRLADARAVALLALALGLQDGGPSGSLPLAAAWAAVGLRGSAGRPHSEFHLR